MNGVLLTWQMLVSIVGTQHVLHDNCVYFCFLKVVSFLTWPIIVFVIRTQHVFYNNFVYLCILKVVSF